MRVLGAKRVHRRRSRTTSRDVPRLRAPCPDSAYPPLPDRALCGRGSTDVMSATPTLDEMAAEANRLLEEADALIARAEERRGRAVAIRMQIEDVIHAAAQRLVAQRG